MTGLAAVAVAACLAASAGPGVFPTGGASNPTYTIFAVSLRGAEQLAAKWSGIAADQV